MTNSIYDCYPNLEGAIKKVRIKKKIKIFNLLIFFKNILKTKIIRAFANFRRTLEYNEEFVSKRHKQNPKKKSQSMKAEMKRRMMIRSVKHFERDKT